MKPDPMGTPRDPFRVFVMFMALANGVTLFSGVPTSDVLDDQMSPLFLRVYGLLLTVSVLAVLGGMYWPADPRTGLLWKRTGYLGLGLSTSIYAAALLNTGQGIGVMLPVTIITAFAIICFSQVKKINEKVNDRILAQEEAE